MISKKNILIGLVIVVIAISFSLYNLEILKPVNKNGEIGIIDGNLTIQHKNIIGNSDIVKSDHVSHGDKMLEFANIYSPDSTIYYYDAVDNYGTINTETIISGLEWMKKNDVRIVNVSLSSSSYSEELENYILENSDELQIYASYNNVLQSFDYPAMYEGVKGVGKETRIEYKDGDISYKKNCVIVLNKIEIFYGNSFLSLIEALKESWVYKCG